MRFPNGFGTVYKLSGNRRKPWIARLFKCWDDSFGKHIPKYDTIGYYFTKEDAIDALTKARINPTPLKSNITVGQLYEEWSKAKYDEDLSTDTINSYKAGWIHLKPLEKILFSELRTAQIQNVINVCRDNKMSRSTLEKAKVVAKMMYDYAIQNDIVNKNYAEFVTLPKAIKQEKEHFTTIEIQKIENSISIPWIDSILVLIYTGFRINEMLNLTVFSADLDNMIIRGGLKTEAGRDRAVPISPKILSIIKAKRDEQGERLISLNGKAMSDDYYRKYIYYPTLKQIGVRELNPHCCRHTFASLLSEKGVDPKVIQMLLGHTKYQFTEDTYIHKDINPLRAAVNML
jgi:integrase